MITIVAHRGASLCAHENTIEAFEQAVALGADMIELDVRRTRDGTLVVFHDPALPVGGGKGLLASMTYGELRRHAAKKNFSVPTLEQVFGALSGKVMLDIELKEPGYEHEVAACARGHFALDKFVLTSFDPKILAAIKAEREPFLTGLIMANADALSWYDSVPVEVVAPEKRLLSSHRPFFAKAKNAGKRIAVWTVDGAALLASLLVDPIIDAIITNRPDRALSLRKKLSGQII
jgi:glycerophosphoryl diester phosphodiesterase